MEKFRVHNTARAQHTRAARTAAPGRAKMKQYIGGELRVLRAVPLIISGEQLEKYKSELIEKQKAGHLEVRTMDGRLVDLVSGTVGSLPPAPLAPHPLPDSAARDTQNVGEKMPQYPGGIPVGAVSSAGGEDGVPGPLGETEVQEALEAEREEPTEEDILLDDPLAEAEMPADTEFTTTTKSSKKSKRK